jgi:P27 family predicted phage terminase small subunit
MPRPKKPSHLKTIEGTSRPDRENPNEPKASGAVPVPPDHLSERESEKFLQLLGYITGMGIASAEDTDALANLASVLVEIEEDQVMLHSLGGPYYVPNPENGMIRKHPAVDRIQTNRMRAQSLLGEFGLTPASRSKVSAHAPDAENPFAALDRVG